MVLLETPSRVWRRIDAAEGEDMPSLPSLPPFEDSAEVDQSTNFHHQPHTLSTVYSESDEEREGGEEEIPVHSTPAPTAISSHTGTGPSVSRFGGRTLGALPSSTSSTARFASSIASRSMNGKSGSHAAALSSLSRATSASAVKAVESFDVSVIPSMLDVSDGDENEALGESEGVYLLGKSKSKDSVPDVYLPPEDDDVDEEGQDERDEREFSLTEALESVSRATSPFPLDEHHPGLGLELKHELALGTDATATPKKYDYSASLRSEAKTSPFDKFRNVALRKPSAHAHARPISTRTPSLSRTASSPSVSSSSSLDLAPSIERSRANADMEERERSSPAPVDPHSDEDGEKEADESGLRESEGGPDQYAQSANEHEHQHEDDYEPAEQQDEKQDEKQEHEPSLEPTFTSSEGGDALSAAPALDLVLNNRAHSPSPALSSPALSLAFTPTPAYPPRPRPRARVGAGFPLRVPSLGEEDDNEEGGEKDDRAEVGEEDDDNPYDPITPHTRRRSFLLDVINSTTRPRMKFPTPHPRCRDEGATPRGHIGEDRDEEEGMTLGGLRTAFAGVTPKQRFGGRVGVGRSSHPLAQTYIPTEETHESASVSPLPATAAAASSGLHLSSLRTPTPFSPYQPIITPSTTTPNPIESDRASFISTASSHDLTTNAYARANVSFDPIMGMGLGERGGGTGVGRFNAGKLNAYLHGLNRRLAEENEGLVGRLRRVEEERFSGSGSAGGRRLSAGKARRISAGSALGDVEEDVGAEGWAEEKKELEEMIEMLTTEVNRCNEAKEAADRLFVAEKDERVRDKERWKERMREVERGVEGIVSDLERKLEEAERKAKEVEQDKVMMERALESVEGERDGAIERAEKVERVLGDGRELGGELKEANDRVAQVMGDLRNANIQIKELEEEVMRSDGRVDELEVELKGEKALVKKLDATLAEANTRSTNTNHELKANSVYIAQLEADAGAAVGLIESLEAQVASMDKRTGKMDAQEEKMDQMAMEAAAKDEFIRQLEEALEAGEKRMIEDEEKVARLEGRLATLENREKDRKQENNTLDTGVDGDVEALELELDDANREIARLNTILNQSPARKAIEKAKDMKVEMLEKEKEDLLERVKVLRNTMNDMGSPGKFVNGTGISPIHRQVLSMSMRAPRTPGAPLRDMSWLNNSAADPTVTPLIAEINRLQRELDRANESIDDKLDKLEDAGLGVVGLTKKLEDARTRIIALEDEIARLSRREDRRIRRLERARCQKCHIKVDLRHVIGSAEVDESSFEVTTGHLPSEPPTPPTKTSEGLRANLLSVNAQLDTMKKQWETEKNKLLGEKAVLQDAAKRLNLQIRSAKEEVKTERLRAGSQGELDKAKQVIADLETDLQAERSRLRSLTTEQSRMQRQKDDVLLQLRRTESDMDDVKRQLQRFKQENYDLEAELRMNASAEQKARLLEVRVMENVDTIEQLRQERSLLVSDHKELQNRFSEISERANKLRDERAASQSSHNNRRHQLDLHLTEVDDLRRALSNQADELQKAEEEKNRVASQKSDVARTVGLLESDLKRVRRDAEAVGRDLKHLRADKERCDAKQKDEVIKTERARKQSQTQIRLLNEQLEGQREKTRRAKEELRTHVCFSADNGQLSAIKVQHNKECKGLIVQIRYLKAKFTRESNLRYDLGYQKQYLLVLLTKFEKSEQRILKSIARIGYPTTSLPRPGRKARSLKSAALSVVFVLRAKRASDLWREQSASKAAVAAALQDVRRRRAVAAS